MASDERDLKHFVDRQLPSPTHMEFTAARDRVLDQMRGTPSHLLTPRIADVAPAVSRWRTGAAIVAAAALIALVAALPFRQAGWIATVEAADGSSYRLEPNTVLSAKDPRGLQLTLKDGARVEMRSASELSLEAGTDGIGIRLLAAVGAGFHREIAAIDRHGNLAALAVRKAAGNRHGRFFTVLRPVGDEQESRVAAPQRQAAVRVLT